MSGGRGQASTGECPRAALLAALRSRRTEIEQAALARVRAIRDPTEPTDPAYLEGLHAAISAALRYGIAAVEQGEERAPAPPPALLVQARVAARNGVSLETVLRRYFAGYSLLNDFLIEEAEGSGLLPRAELKRLLRGQALLFDRLLAAVSEEHGREQSSRPGTSGQRRTERVRRLLAGEPLADMELGYDLGAHHLAAIVSGPGATRALNELATCLDRRLLVVRPEEARAWGWLGGARGLGEAELAAATGLALSPHTALALGEPGQGLAGWRQSHRQASAALPLAQRRPGAPLRYAEVALLASILRDDLLTASLRQLYLEPLGREPDGGRAARETLCAYFAAGRNVSSAAAGLGVKRHTVTNRLRAIEERLGRPLEACAAELEVALRLQEVAPLLPPSGYR